MADAVQSWNLPRTLCKPLKAMFDVTKGPPLVDLAAVHGAEEERMTLECPDLQASNDYCSALLTGTFLYQCAS